MPNMAACPIGSMPNMVACPIWWHAQYGGMPNMVISASPSSGTAGRLAEVVAEDGALITTDYH